MRREREREREGKRERDKEKERDSDCVLPQISERSNQNNYSVKQFCWLSCQLR